MRLLIVLLAAALAAGPALAACPDTEGRFDAMNGRASEAWCSYPPDGGGTPGNTLNALSWDGAALGTEWHVWGMAVDAAGPQLLYSYTDGNGYLNVGYLTHYTGGQIRLDGAGPWGDGFQDLTGAIAQTEVTIHITYSDPVVAVSNIHMTGLIDDCDGDCVIEYIISNAALAWHPSMGGTPPADYPDLLCGAITGELFDICCPTITISCVIPNETTTWSSLKSLYR